MDKHCKILLYLIILCCPFSALAQDYRAVLHIVDLRAYQRQIKTDPDKRLIEIKKEIPGIVLDIRYATTNNFMHRVMYSQARAFARAPVVKALQEVEVELNKQGLGLKIYDAYRPYTVTVAFFKMAHDTNFVASPKHGSHHNRGCAIDLSVIDLKTGRELEMPTPFDSFSVKAAANYPALPAIQLANRELLKSAMQAHGFKVLPTEWWHFDFIGWEHYELLDIPFSGL